LTHLIHLDTPFLFCQTVRLKEYDMETNSPGPKWSKAQRWLWGTVRSIARDPARRQEAIVMLEAALATPGDFLDSEIPTVEHERDQWRWSLDADFQPAQYPHEDAARVLEIKTGDCMSAEDYQSALHFAWGCLQYSAAGTVQFCHALSDMADCAAMAGRMLLARQTVQMYLMHYDLLLAAANEPATPVGYHTITTLSIPAEQLGPVFFCIPVDAALRGLVSDPQICWVRTLELAVYKVPFRHGGLEDRLQQATAALVAYYTQTGDTEALDRLNAYLTETQPQ
jgi:hypothetical protein